MFKTEITKVLFVMISRIPKTLFILIILISCCFIININTLTFAVIESSNEQYSSLIPSNLGTANINWFHGLQVRNKLIFSATPGIGYNCDVSENEVHVYETTGTYDVHVGAFAIFPVTNGVLSFSFEARAKADHVDPPRIWTALYDNSTNEMMYLWRTISPSGVLDTGFRSFNYTVILEEHTEVKVFFFYPDGWVANWNQEFWIKNLEILTDINTEAVITDNILNYFSAPPSTPFGLVWHDNFLWNVLRETGKIYKYNPNTGEYLESWDLVPSDPMALTFDGEYFWYSGLHSKVLYKYDSSFNVVDSISIPVESRGGLAFDGDYLWIMNEFNSLLYQIDPSNGEIVNSIPMPGTRIADLEHDSKYLWACDYAEAKIYVINPSNGNIIKSFNTPFNGPWGITIDNNSNLWITDSISQLILQLKIKSLEDEVPPIITNSGDLNYVEDTSGNYINWTLQDENPDNYSIYRNDSFITSGIWENNDTIVLNVDFLPVGVYNYSLISYDTYGNMAFDTILVTVTTAIAESGKGISLLAILSFGAMYLFMRRKRKIKLKN